MPLPAWLEQDLAAADDYRRKYELLRAYVLRPLPIPDSSPREQRETETSLQAHHPRSSMDEPDPHKSVPDLIPSFITETISVKTEQTDKERASNHWDQATTSHIPIRREGSEEVHAEEVWDSSPKLFSSPDMTPSAAINELEQSSDTPIDYQRLLSTPQKIRKKPKAADGAAHLSAEHVQPDFDSIKDGEIFPLSDGLLHGACTHKDHAGSPGLAPLDQQLSATKDGNEVWDDNLSSSLSKPSHTDIAHPDYYGLTPRAHAICDTVRIPGQRKLLKGVECAACAGWYKANASTTAPAKLAQISKHRVITPKPQTPPNFWALDFPHTQEIEQMRSTKTRARQ